MKREFILSTLLIIIVSNISYSQRIYRPQKGFFSINQYDKRVEKVQGSQYQFNEFRPGDIQINETTYEELLRYNAFSDEIQLRGNTGEIISLLKRPYIKASIDNINYGIHSFVNDNKIKNGYFIEHSKNIGNVIFLERFKKVLVKTKEATSSYKKDIPAKLIDQSTYYIKVGNEPAQLIKLNKKGVISNFSSKKTSELERYVKENGLKLKTKNEVIQLVNYYNSII